jgi:hypothetical protein
MKAWGGVDAGALAARTRAGRMAGAASAAAPACFRKWRLLIGSETATFMNGSKLNQNDGLETKMEIVRQGLLWDSVYSSSLARVFRAVAPAHDVVDGAPKTDIEILALSGSASDCAPGVPRWEASFLLIGLTSLTCGFGGELVLASVSTIAISSPTNAGSPSKGGWMFQTTKPT